MHGITEDLFYAARGLRQSPGFALTAVVTLAIGIGANAAVFTRAPCSSAASPDPSFQNGPLEKLATTFEDKPAIMLTPGIGAGAPLRETF